MNIVMGDDVLSPAEVKSDLNRIQRDLTQRLSNQVAQHTVAIKMGRDGLVISLREAGFFDSGSATPHPEALSTLRQIAASLAGSPYDLRIEGHTDNIPIHTAQFDSNWELSTARAIRIARLLLDLHAIPPDRLSAAGYAEFHPVDTNDTPQGRANNRRVDLIVLPRTKVDLSVPGSPDPPASGAKSPTAMRRKHQPLLHNNEIAPHSIRPRAARLPHWECSRFDASHGVDPVRLPGLAAVL